MKAFFQSEEAGTFYTLTEAQKINSFENVIKDPTDINFYIAEKREWKKLPTNQQTFNAYYNSMSASYGGLQSLVRQPCSRITK